MTSCSETLYFELASRFDASRKFSRLLWRVNNPFCVLEEKLLYPCAFRDINVPQCPLTLVFLKIPHPAFH